MNGAENALYLPTDAWLDYSFRGKVMPCQPCLVGTLCLRRKCASDTAAPSSSSSNARAFIVTIVPHFTRRLVCPSIYGRLIHSTCFTLTPRKILSVHR